MVTVRDLVHDYNATASANMRLTLHQEEGLRAYDRMLRGALESGSVDGCSTKGFEDIPPYLLGLIRFDAEPDPLDVSEDSDVVMMCD